MKLMSRLLFRLAAAFCTCVLIIYILTHHRVLFSPKGPMYLNARSLDLDVYQKPTVCSGDLVCVVVSSAIGNFERRQTIRQTWASNATVHFLLGQPTNSSMQLAIDEEAATYDDIVQGFFVDTYRNLTYKSVMGLTWARDHCSSPFILKVDDDIYVNLKNVQHFAAQQRSGDIYCQVARRVQVVRSLSSDLRKWYVTKQEYSKRLYPDYCLGSFGVLFRRTALSDLLEQVSKVPFFWIEDVYITGLLRERTRLRLKQIPPKKLVRELSKFSARNASSVILGPIELGAEQMSHLWQNISERSTV